MKKVGTTVICILTFFILTVISQIGGFIWLASYAFCKTSRIKSRLKLISIFILLYLISTFLFVPIIAPIFGREKIKNTIIIKPTSFVSIVFNRNYVTPEVNNVLQLVAQSLQERNGAFQIKYLDANFPFGHFPLWPHRSHTDGLKIDLSFIYKAKSGTVSNKKKSISGYGVFEQANKDERDQTEICKSRGFWQYDFPKYLTLGQINKDLVLAESETASLLRAILKQPQIQKVFVEPHLVRRLKVEHPKMRYHGCAAVRHDDHIHIQIK